MEFVEAFINGKYKIVLPDFRAEFHLIRPTWEIGRVDHCATTMTPGKVVFDVGAEHGDFTALYRSWVGPEGMVIPIEPQPGYWPCIRETYEANGFEPPRGWFVGFASDETATPIASDVGPEFGEQSWPMCAYGPIVPDFGFRHLAQQTHHTPQTTIDDLADRLLAWPDAVVIDVEGAEWNVLNGMTRCLNDKDINVYVSVHEPTMWNWYQKTLQDLHQLMGLSGYAGEELPHHGEGETFWLYQKQ